MTKNKKTVFKVIGALFLGGVGNGLWEYILKPIFNLSSEFTLNLISFGIQNFQNKIYQEIAKNLHESTGVSILGHISSFALAIILGSSIFLFILKYSVKYKNQIIDKKLSERNSAKKLLLYCLCLIFATSFFLGDYLRIAYINSSISKYNQLLTIVTPYIEEATINKFKSSFALINDKSDYDKIIQDLIQITGKNNIDIKNIK